ncbi:MULTISPECIES: cytochrome c biogenesis protein ResB [unclassified Rathayibacter]|uniref:cytochrome c biogenesis protein ResB n=1 Tax=unclassified Rathayibacter TaxID=2609250 RepID=UPI0009E6966F|nr:MULTISPECIES: cytochrome c biogenesis protein ResB [unclassified Rathayibacter]
MTDSASSRSRSDAEAGLAVGPSRPVDHIDAVAEDRGEIREPRLGPVGWIRWVWRQLTSMRTALFLLLLLAIASIPGSLVPQRSSDPNGVAQYFINNPDIAPLLEKVQAFDTYTSIWFSSIYLLLFVSLIGCVIPRTKHHVAALRALPPKTPVRLERLVGYRTAVVEEPTAGESITAAQMRLRKAGYRTARYDTDRPGRVVASVAAERGYLRETGNLVFHLSLVGLLVCVGFGGGFGYAGQRVIVEGQSLSNTLASYDSFNPGRFFVPEQLDPFTLKLEDLSVTYEEENRSALGQPIDFTASVSTRLGPSAAESSRIKVNEPISVGRSNIYLLGNGYAPTITMRDPGGRIVFSEPVPFLPQDSNMTSIGVVKVPDGLATQVGMTGFFYPSEAELPSGASTSNYPDLVLPVLSLDVFTGDLGLDGGIPASVYTLNTDDLTRVTGGSTGTASLRLQPGETAELPGGLGSISFDAADSAATGGESVLRFASFDINADPTESWVLVFSILIVAGLLTSLFVARRRVWVKATAQDDGTVLVEYAGLARGEDPHLAHAVAELARTHLTGPNREP